MKIALAAKYRAASDTNLHQHRFRACLDTQ